MENSAEQMKRALAVCHISHISHARLKITINSQLNSLDESEYIIAPTRTCPAHFDRRRAIHHVVAKSP